MKKKIYSTFQAIVVLVTIMIPCTVLAQNEEVVHENLNYHSYTGNAILVIKQLKLTPGFTISAEDDGEWYARMYETHDNVPLSSDQNYVRTETAQQGTTSQYAFSGWPVEKRTIDFGYFDGLGRDIQSVSVEISPDKKDVVQVVEYDDYGRQAKSYLPYTKTSEKGKYRSNGLVEQGSFYNTESLIDQDTKPYSLSVFENSPLNRVLEQYGPGSDWHNNAKKVKTWQKVNVGNEVKKFVVNGNAPTYNNYYAAKTLIKTEVISEEGNTVIEYTDSRGLTVLKKIWESGNNWLSTHYVYDDLGNLRFVLPPEALNGNVVQDKYIFKYEYDNQQRMSKKKIPGMDGWVYMVYDRWDRLVLTQDPVQETNNEWSFTKYDEFNRPIITGVYPHNNTHAQMITAVGNAINHHESTNNTETGYTLNLTYPTNLAGGQRHTITYYDDYAFLNNPGWANNGGYNFLTESGFTGTKHNAVKGQVTGSKTKVLGINDWLNSVVYYDDKYQPLQTITENYLGSSATRVTMQYDFVGKVLKTKTAHGSLEMLEEFTYDHAGRLLDTHHTIDDGERILLTSNTYNELGELIEKNVHSTNNGDSYLQSVDYRYNIRGWLTSINNAVLDNDGTKNNDATDLFGMELRYNDPALAINGMNTVPKYDGNIAAIKWGTNNHEDAVKEHIYGYDYDGPGRLKKARYATASGQGAFNQDADMYRVDGLVYDDNGNIQDLRRYANINGQQTAMDELDYQYDGNRLKSVDDTQSDLGFADGVDIVTEYGYDENGNMTSDLNKGLVDIQYNHLNLPTYVEFEEKGSITYTYDGTGVKLQKVVKDNNDNILSSTNYEGNFQYENNELAFIITAEGRAVREEITDKIDEYNYEYFHKDHLGNTRLVYGYLNEIDVYKATVETSQAQQEEADFDNLTHRDNTHNHTAPSMAEDTPTESIITNGANATATGAITYFEVKAGDKVSMEVFARFNGNSGNLKDVLEDVGGSLISALGQGGAVTETVSGAINTHLPGVSSGINSFNTPVKAYLNYLVFDKNYNNVPQTSYASVPSAAANAFQSLEKEITIPFDGFIYIYVANESNYDVWFDDFTIVHEKTAKSLQVTQSNDYYPFGLTFNNYQQERDNSNRIKFQGQESQEELDLGWAQFKWRNSDPATGRFFNIDPLAEDYYYNSTYAFSENKLVNGIELEGLEFLSMENNNYGQGALNALTGTASSEEITTLNQQTEVAVNEVAGNAVKALQTLEPDGAYAKFEIALVKDGALKIGIPNENVAFGTETKLLDFTGSYDTNEGTNFGFEKSTDVKSYTSITTNGFNVEMGVKTSMDYSSGNVRNNTYQKTGMQIEKGSIKTSVFIQNNYNNVQFSVAGDIKQEAAWGLTIKGKVEAGFYYNKN